VLLIFFGVVGSVAGIRQPGRRGWARVCGGDSGDAASRQVVSGAMLVRVEPTDD
jgi:hypothetical protein